MVPRSSIVFIDAVAIVGAHDSGVWNAIYKVYSFNSVNYCVEEATRANKYGRKLVNRDISEVKKEIACHEVSAAEIAKLEFMLDGTVDLDDGEKALLALALHGTNDPTKWWISALVERWSPGSSRVRNQLFRLSFSSAHGIPHCTFKLLEAV